MPQAAAVREGEIYTLPEEVIPARPGRRVRYRCDKCGREITREDHGDDYAHELNVWLDMEECVSFFRQRDYCPACLEPVWAALNGFLGTDPDKERDPEEDYG